MELPFIIANVAFTSIMLGLSFALVKWPPKKINYWYGHRTAKSMKSQEAWDFANACSGRLFTYFSIALVALQVLVMLIADAEKSLWMTIIYILISPFLIIYLTEKKLSNRVQAPDKKS